LYRVGKRSWTGRVERSHEGTHQHKLGLVAYPRVGRAHNTWETPILNGAGGHSITRYCESVRLKEAQTVG
jgi:hypothetical protein